MRWRLYCEFCLVQHPGEPLREYWRYYADEWPSFVEIEWAGPPLPGARA